jgi:hypothetical protein
MDVIDVTDSLYDLLDRQIKQAESMKKSLEAIAYSLDVIAERLTRLAKASESRKDVIL